MSPKRRGRRKEKGKGKHEEERMEDRWRRRGGGGRRGSHILDIPLRDGRGASQLGLTQDVVAKKGHVTEEVGVHRSPVEGGGKRKGKRENRGRTEGGGGGGRRDEGGRREGHTSLISHSGMGGEPANWDSPRTS
jgi:hypothetical protein